MFSRIFIIASDFSSSNGNEKTYNPTGSPLESSIVDWRDALIQSLNGSEKYYSSSLTVVAGTTPEGKSMKLWNIESVKINLRYLASSCLIEGTTKAGLMQTSMFAFFHRSKISFTYSFQVLSSE